MNHAPVSNIVYQHESYCWIGVPRGPFNDTIRASAAASPHDIDYVDVSEALDGHELCTADPWMVDLASELNDVPGIGSGGSTERGHPNLQGQIAYTDAVAAGLE